MKWIKNLLGLNNPLKKKKKELSKIRHAAMLAQRNGNLRKYADLNNLAEMLEDEIIEIINESK